MHVIDRGTRRGHKRNSQTSADWYLPYKEEDSCGGGLMWTSADWYQHIKRRTHVEEDSCGRQQIGINI